VLVRRLLLAAKHLFLAAKQWQFVLALWVRWGTRQAVKGMMVRRTAREMMIKNQIFKFRETARKPEIRYSFGCRGQKNKVLLRVS
jgi:hypothetical protein